MAEHFPRERMTFAQLHKRSRTPFKGRNEIDTAITNHRTFEEKSQKVLLRGAYRTCVAELVRLAASAMAAGDKAALEPIFSAMEAQWSIMRTGVDVCEVADFMDAEASRRRAAAREDAALAAERAQMAAAYAARQAQLAATCAVASNKRKRAPPTLLRVAHAMAADEEANLWAFLLEPSKLFDGLGDDGDVDWNNFV